MLNAQTSRMAPSPRSGPERRAFSYVVANSAGTFGFTTIDHVQVAPGSITAFIPIWVQSTGKLALLVPSTGVEVANTTNVSTAIVDVIIYGR